ncbi:D-serine ammonia-lyase [Sporolactobacillus sp. THM7-4]|nr:D-serine ammonia-lyase [Sporolactobacillus sp. THM7-4]
MDRYVGNKTISQWVAAFPVLKKITAKEEVLWLNTCYEEKAPPQPGFTDFTVQEIIDADKRLQRFAPYIESVFPKTQKAHGQIESPLYLIPKMQTYLEKTCFLSIPGRLVLKADNELPISGSIKARGGIYEVLKIAEQLALDHGMLRETDNYADLANESFHQFFSQFSISVGSTGNLGLSIGIIGAKLGFRTVVHMSKDARQWKKDLLRQRGAEVREYDADYSVAVKEGRRQASLDSRCHFIDDEHSRDLFAGYATAGLRLKKQFDQMGLVVDDSHPLFVYLPCGVGGGPGGVTFGLKQAFGSHVHVFFAEPTHSPCFLLGLLTGLHDAVSVQDFQLDNQTAADGLAVPRASAFAGRASGHLISGCLTIDDERLFQLLKAFADEENIQIEPSAAAGGIGPVMLLQTTEGRRYLKEHHLINQMSGATHLIWATGGSMVPRKVWETYYKRAADNQ